MVYVGLSRLYRGQDITILDLNSLYQQEMLHLGLDQPIQDRAWYGMFDICEAGPPIKKDRGRVTFKTRLYIINT